MKKHRETIVGEVKSIQELREVVMLIGNHEYSDGRIVAPNDVLKGLDHILDVQNSRGNIDSNFDSFRVFTQKYGLRDKAVEVVLKLNKNEKIMPRKQT